MTHDLGIRCSRHVGEVFQPRCYECMDLQPRRTPTVGGRCALHPDYPANDRFECARCAREREEPTNG